MSKFLRFLHISNLKIKGLWPEIKGYLHGIFGFRQFYGFQKAETFNKHLEIQDDGDGRRVPRLQIVGDIGSSLFKY